MKNHDDFFMKNHDAFHGNPAHLNFYLCTYAIKLKYPHS